MRWGYFRPMAVSLLLLSGLLLSGCATPYGSEGLTGGFSQKELEPGIWRLTYNGNGFTTPETVQTYWLYRAASLTLEQGFDGFQILSNINLVQNRSIVHEPVKLAAGSVPIIVPMYMPNVPKPTLEGDIKLLKLPFDLVPGKVFNAAGLKGQLDPIVTGQKCDMGNVCAHVHHYVYDAPAPVSAPAVTPAATAPAAPVSATN